MSSRPSGFEPLPHTIPAGASPWTVPPDPGCATTLFVRGGTVSSITLNGVQVVAATNVALPLEAGDTVVITYSVVPTVLRRLRS